MAKIKITETVLRDGRFLYTVMEVCYDPESPALTEAQCYFSPALQEDSSPEVPAYLDWVIGGLQVATAHQNDPKRKKILEDLSSRTE